MTPTSRSRTFPRPTAMSAPNTARAGSCKFALISARNHWPAGAGTAGVFLVAEHRVNVLLLDLLHLPPLFGVALVLPHLVRGPGIGLAVVPAIRHQQAYPTRDLVQLLARKLHALVPFFEHRQQLTPGRAGEVWRQRLRHRLRANPVDPPALAVASERFFRGRLRA